MSGNQQTLGQALDQILNALSPLEDGARRTALTAACMQLGISFSDVGASTEQGRPSKQQTDQRAEPSVAAPNPALVPVQQAVQKIDIRSFKEQKKPTSARQMACLVAFFLQELAPINDRKETINCQDLEKYFKQAGFKLPSKMKQILIDSKSAGYFDSPARGEYKLNAVGYNLVAHGLPNGTE